MILHCLETSIMFLVSLLGFSVNTFFFLKMSSIRNSMSSFQKLCFVKGLSNALICASIIFWAVPLSAFLAKTENVWRNLNIGISELTASGGYIFGPLCQILMAANRLIALYLPIWRMKIVMVHFHIFTQKRMFQRKVKLAMVANNIQFSPRQN
ncbi:CRE-SRX-133 protein [Caenorhabditis remanei]|uniref:CRE-SRX-133 protein n=1 Tax=Caenorhabditis remanei TaxID=31234 RepID=E3M0G2_CAERE|nr:CRE-SRX-133 protein [Caenorhabditis remanei]